MTEKEAIALRHSVRSYLPQPIEKEKLELLRQEVARCNEAGHLHIQLVTDDPVAFSGRMAHYGKFSQVNNYLALVGRKEAGFEERLGYYGQRLALLIQTLGMNSCWVALTYSKTERIELSKEERLPAVMAFGYGATQGVAHKSKAIEKVASGAEPWPDWFRNGVEAALLAPTAINQQRFHFTLRGEKVQARAGLGLNTHVDLGIAKYHFEVGSGRDHTVWVD
ncbi:MAG: nitroreductase [Bacteroidales bacterium]|nr:nitroreductase [Bacteroidales bacterium]